MYISNESFGFINKTKTVNNKWNLLRLCTILETLAAKCLPCLRLLLQHKTIHSCSSSSYSETLRHATSLTKPGLLTTAAEFMSMRSSRLIQLQTVRTSVRTTPTISKSLTSPATTWTTRWTAGSVDPTSQSGSALRLMVLSAPSLMTRIGASQLVATLKARILVYLTP